MGRKKTYTWKWKDVVEILVLLHKEAKVGLLDNADQMRRVFCGGLLSLLGNIQVFCKQVKVLKVSTSSRVRTSVISLNLQPPTPQLASTARRGWLWSQIVRLAKRSFRDCMTPQDSNILILRAFLWKLCKKSLKRKEKKRKRAKCCFIICVCEVFGVWGSNRQPTHNPHSYILAQ